MEWLYSSSHGTLSKKGLGKNDLTLENGYIVHALTDKLPYIFEQNIKTGYITKAHFEKGEAPEFTEAELQLQLLGPELVKKQATLAKEEIKKRNQERANFFYLVNVREKKKNNEKETRDLSAFLELDKKYMGYEVRNLFEAEDLTPSLLENDNFVLFTVKLPGTNQKTTEKVARIKIK